MIASQPSAPIVGSRPRRPITSRSSVADRIRRGPGNSTRERPNERELRSELMDYAKPTEVAASMVAAGRYKLTLAPRDLLIRGALSGAILGVATSLAITGAV